ncbi:MAG: hypothetical protein AB2551_21170 [Candidatus Thiodiazotropha sp.]|nr:hypothetical protein [Pseudomonadales bacterium]
MSISIRFEPVDEIDSDEQDDFRLVDWRERAFRDDIRVPIPELGVGEIGKARQSN